MNNFEPKDTNGQARKANPNYKPTKDNRAPVSDGDIDRFIENEMLNHPKNRKKDRRIIRNEELFLNKLNIPFMSKDRLVNPIKLNISKNTLSKIKK